MHPSPPPTDATPPIRPLVSARATQSVVVALTLLILAPMAAHLTWRPLAFLLGSPIEGVALQVTMAAVALCAVTTALFATDRASMSWLGAPFFGALLLGAVLGGAAGAGSLVLLVAAIVWLFPRMQRDIQSVQGATSAARLLAWTAPMLLIAAASANLATYFGDPLAPDVGFDREGFVYRHFCASAYLHAAELVRSGVDNVYDLALVSDTDNAWLPPSAAHMAPFTLDRYGYPPQFIAIPLVLVSWVGDFAAQRAIWTTSSALILAMTLWRVGIWVGPNSGRVARAIGPVLWGMGLPVFQSGNIQLTVLCVGVLAMMAIHERRDRLGGFLLASVTLAKIAPGLLGVILLLRARWRAVVWTVGSAVVVTFATLVWLGPGPFEAFVQYHLPRISTGEAYDFLDDTPRTIFENLSPFGIPFKLASLGLIDADPWTLGPRFAQGYTVLAFVLTAIAGRRNLDRRGHIVVWLLVLTMGALRSPMGPGYLIAGVLWGLSLGAAELRTAKGWAAGFFLMALNYLTAPFFGENLWFALGAQAVMHGTITWLLLRHWPALDANLPPQGL